jgi:predicted anti-sigma-YlaC factor YlaD
MFRCSEVAERASRMIDGELESWQRANMKLHLALCRGCRAFMAQMRKTKELTELVGAVGAAGDPVPSEDIQAALARRQRRSGKQI